MLKERFPARSDSLVLAYIVVFIIGIVFAVRWAARRVRTPIRSFWMLTIGQMVLPIGPVASLVLPRFFSGRGAERPLRRAERIGGAAAYIGTTLVALARDLLGQTTSSSVIRVTLASPNAPDGAPIPLTPVPLIAWVVLFVGVPFAVGYMQRAKENNAALTRRMSRETERATNLKTQLDSAQFRQDLATQIHDSIGHTLSLMALQANSIRLLADQQAPDLASRAADLQALADEATDDLHTVVRALKGAEAAPAAEPSPEARATAHPLADLPAQVDEIAGRGQVVSSSISLSDAVASPELGEVTYRVVRELLTNAVKHAGGAIVRIWVVGTPEMGVNIYVANPLRGGAGEARGGADTAGRGVGSAASPVGMTRTTGAASAGARGAAAGSTGGTGVPAMRKRVQKFGGWMTTGTENGEYFTRVWLPWR